MEETRMRELIRDVAEVTSNLVTLNLLDRGDVYVDNQEILCLCLELFQELRAKNGHPMGVLENDLCSKLTVEFYEQ